MIKYKTFKDIIMSQLASDTAHINNIFGAHNIGVIMGILGVQYSGSYGADFFGTISSHAPLVDNSMAVSLTVANTDMYY